MSRPFDIRLTGRLGLRRDIIVGVGKSNVKDEADLFDALEEFLPGDKVDIQVLRVGQKGMLTPPAPPAVSVVARLTPALHG